MRRVYGRPSHWGIGVIITHRKYGEVELELMGEGSRPIRGLLCEGLPDEWKFFGVETGEKLALILEDTPRAQIVFQYPWTPDYAGYLFMHDSTSTGQVARVVRLDYKWPVEAQEVIRGAAHMVSWAP